MSQCRPLAFDRCICAIMITLLAVPAQLGAQAAAASAPQAPATIAPMAPLPMVKSLKVTALAGDQELNDLERRLMAPLVVEVRDQNDRPIEGAEVVFRFPPTGPGAMFPEQKFSQKVRSNSQGQAAATGWMANNQTGSFPVHVTASFNEQLGETTLSMTNATRVIEGGNQTNRKRREAKPWWSSRLVKIGLVAGAAGLGAGIVLATRGSSSSPTVTISTGSPTVGGPR